MVASSRSKIERLAVEIAIMARSLLALSFCGYNVASGLARATEVFSAVSQFDILPSSL
jgi:hypothetical protein